MSMVKEIRDSLNISDKKAREILLLINDRIDQDKYLNSMPGWTYIHKYSWHERVLEICNKLIGGYGMESYFLSGRSKPLFSYVNTGDTYNCTVLYDYEEAKFLITSYGDWLENPERQAELFELSLDHINEAMPRWCTDASSEEIFAWMWKNDQEALESCECCDASHPSEEAVEKACIAMGYKEDEDD